MSPKKLRCPIRALVEELAVRRARKNVEPVALSSASPSDLPRSRPVSWWSLFLLALRARRWVQLRIWTPGGRPGTHRTVRGFPAEFAGDWPYSHSMPRRSRPSSGRRAPLRALLAHEHPSRPGRQVRDGAAAAAAGSLAADNYRCASAKRKGTAGPPPLFGCRQLPMCVCEAKGDGRAAPFRPPGSRTSLDPEPPCLRISLRPRPG
jgi:hypothetical protein